MAGPVVLAMLALAALYLARDYELWSFGAPGPGLLPTLAAVLMLVASVASLRETPSGEGAPRDRRRVASYVTGLVLLMPGTTVLGLLPTLAVFVAVILRFVEGLRLAHVVAIAGLSALASWMLFEKLLEVPLPKPFFW